MSVFPLAQHRLVIGYHGCERSIAEEILLGKSRIKPSKNKYDWLGRGIYFWEHSPNRALDFAKEKRTRRKVREPFVLGAYINLGRCLDLCDIEATNRLAKFYPGWEKKLKEAKRQLPANKAAGKDDHDLLLRYLDCAVLNAFLEYVDVMQADSLDEKATERYYQTVRGVFIEGNPAFPGSKILTKTHTQISVRDPSCILGFFNPVSWQEKEANDEQK